MDRRNKLTITLLSTAHFVLDSYSSFLFQLLPLMAVKLRLTPAQAGLVPPMLTVTSSLMQPVYGIISDRYLKRSMVVFGPLIAAIFLSCLGMADSLPGLIALVILGGVGVGMFHPQGAALVSRAASSDGLDRRQGMMMSVFSSAGTVGFALGPLLVAMAVNRYGLENSWYTAIWGVAFWVVLFRHCPPLEQKGRAEGAPAFGGRGQRADLLAVRVEKFRDDRDGVRLCAGRIPLLRRGGRIFLRSVGRPARRAARLDGGDARRRASAAGGVLDARGIKQCVI